MFYRLIHEKWFPYLLRRGWIICPSWCSDHYNIYTSGNQRLTSALYRLCRVIMANWVGRGKAKLGRVMRKGPGRHDTWFRVTSIWSHLLKMAAVIEFSFKERFLWFRLLFPDFYHFHLVIWGMKLAKKLKTKNGQNMSSGPFFHAAAQLENYGHAFLAGRADLNRPFPSSPQPPFQSEAKCEVFVMKISFHSYWNWN